MNTDASLTLTADIGGTNARFALADPAAASPLDIASVREYPVTGSLRWLMPHGIIWTRSAHARDRACSPWLAGRPAGDEVRITNHPWVISRTRTRDMLGFEQLRLINDFAAQAMAIPLLAPEDIAPIGAAGWSPGALGEPALTP